MRRIRPSRNHVRDLTTKRSWSRCTSKVWNWKDLPYSKIFRNSCALFLEKINIFHLQLLIVLIICFSNGDCMCLWFVLERIKSNLMLVKSWIYFSEGSRMFHTHLYLKKSDSIFHLKTNMPREPHSICFWEESRMSLYFLSKRLKLLYRQEKSNSIA